VFFDNLVVNLRHGPLLELNDYYPFGMQIPGLSTQSYKYQYNQNRYKFNGIEYDTAFGLDYYEARFRDYDPQIGRFTQIDPKVESAEGWSVYSGMLDNPILNSDPLGDSTIIGAGFWRNAWEGIKDGGKETGSFIKSLGTVQGWENLGDGVLNTLRTDPSNPLAQSIVKGAAAIPNMTRDEAGHAFGYGAEKIGEAVLLSKGAGLAKDALTASTSTTLYRAASEGEVSDIAKNGLQTKPGAYETNKLFATSASDAAQFGKNNFAFDGQANTILKAKVPNSVMKTSTTFEADGMKAVAIPSNQLQRVNWVRPLNYTPKPSNPFGSLGW
jgi:RHS repeat-associated protein